MFTSLFVLPLGTNVRLPEDILQVLWAQSRAAVRLVLRVNEFSINALMDIKCVRMGRAFQGS